jgi:hypothetical protein
MLTTIEKRLAILTPDPAKLEHFAALQKAYQHYKTLEALCEVPKEESIWEGDCSIFCGICYC